MPYDPTLTVRLRVALTGTEPLIEKRMFGGACLMWGGHMLCGVTGAGGYLFRVGPEGLPAALALPGVTPMEMAGRTMKGYVVAEAVSLTFAEFSVLIALSKKYVSQKICSVVNLALWKIIINFWTKSTCGRRGTSGS